MLFELKRWATDVTPNINHHLLSSQTRRRENCISFRAKIGKEMRLVFSQELTITGTIRDLLFSGKGRRMVVYRGLLISWFTFSSRCILETTVLTELFTCMQSTVYGSNKGTRIASLVLDIANSTTDNSTTHFVLDASSTNQTQIYLVKAPSAPASHASMSIDSDENTNPVADLESGDIPVMLQLPIFDATQASMVRYCTTFDPSPEGPGGPLTAEPCFPWSTNADANTNATQTHKSQAFTFNENTGVVRPMWFNGEDDGTDHGNNASVEDDGYQGGYEDGDEAAQAPVANEDPQTPVGG